MTLNTAASTAAVTFHPGLRPDRPYDLAGCSRYLEALRRPLLVTIVSASGRCDQHLRQPGAGRRLVGFPQMGAKALAWATTGTLDDRSHHADLCGRALTPGFRRSPPAAKGEARLQLEVGTGTAISNIAEWGGFNVTFIIATWVPSRPTRLWLFGCR